MYQKQGPKGKVAFRITSQNCKLSGISNEEEEEVRQGTSGTYKCPGRRRPWAGLTRGGAGRIHGAPGRKMMLDGERA